VIGQREHVDATLGSACDDGRRRQQSIRVRRMAVQVVARHRNGGAGWRRSVRGARSADRSLRGLVPDGDVITQMRARDVSVALF